MGAVRYELGWLLFSVGLLVADVIVLANGAEPQWLWGAYAGLAIALILFWAVVLTFTERK